MIFALEHQFRAKNYFRLNVGKEFREFFNQGTAKTDLSSTMTCKQRRNHYKKRTYPLNCVNYVLCSDFRTPLHFFQTA